MWVLFRLLVRVVIALAIVTVTIILVRAVDSRKLPELRVWHTVELESEYRAQRDGDIDGFAAHLTQEQRVFDELNAKVYSQVPAEEQAAPSRYSQDKLRPICQAICTRFRLEYSRLQSLSGN